MTRTQNSRSRKRESFVLTFDEKNREDYLTGFSKRKKLRKEKAKEEKLGKLKALKSEKKQQKKKPLVEKPTEVSSTSKSFDIGEHSVVVTEYDMFNQEEVKDEKPVVDMQIATPNDKKELKKKTILKANKFAPKKGSKSGKSKKTSFKKSKTVAKTKRNHLKPNKPRDY